MRIPLTVLFAAFAIGTTPAMAQNTNQNAKVSTPQTETAKPSQNSNSGQSKPAPAPQSKPAQDNSMADYDVLGSTAQAAFGHDGP
jgi:hypothetical protein